MFYSHTILLGIISAWNTSPPIFYTAMLGHGGPRLRSKTQPFEPSQWTSFDVEDFTTSPDDGALHLISKAELCKPTEEAQFSYLYPGASSVGQHGALVVSTLAS